LLSGGVDSTVIAEMARRHGDVRAFNFSASRDPQLDEAPMARLVAQKLELPLESIAIDGETYRRELARATSFYEMPLWHMQGIPTHVAARRARAEGIEILLSGVSVGPLLGAATDRYRWILTPPVLDHVPERLLRVVRKATYSKDGLPIAAPFFTRTLGIGLQLVDGGGRFRMVGRCNEAYRFLGNRSERRVHVMRLTDNALFLPRFFHQGDRLCMGESVEYCDASVETGFMSLALNLRTDVIFHKKIPKWILKELATRFVPREVAFQKKRPVWNVPVAEYFAPLFKPSLFKDGFLASFLALDWRTANDLYAREKDKTQLLYRLVNIETWGRLFFMGHSVEEVTELLVH
jgi:asparagine synthase (glutamine-hydrolysing)